MQLYDYDDKMLVSDQTQLRLWDFFDHKEECPELVTVLEFNDREKLKMNAEQDKSAVAQIPQNKEEEDENEPIDCVKVNKVSEQHGDKKNVFFYVVSQRNKFKVYHGKLEPLVEGDISASK